MASNMMMGYPYCKTESVASDIDWHRKFIELRLDYNELYEKYELSQANMARLNENYLKLQTLYEQLLPYTVKDNKFDEIEKIKIS